MQTDTPAQKIDFPTAPVTLAVRMDRQLTKLERDVAILAASQEFLARGRRHDA